MSGEGWGIPEQTDPAGHITPGLSHLAPVDDRPGIEPFTVMPEQVSCTVCGATLASITIQVPVVLRAFGGALAQMVTEAIQQHAPEYCPTCSVEWIVEDAARAAWRIAQRPGSPVVPCALDHCAVGGPHHHTDDLAITRLSPLVARFKGER